MTPLEARPKRGGSMPAGVVTAPHSLVAAARDVAPAAFAAVAVTPLAVAGGGYEPPSWGYAALALLWIALLSLLLRGEILLDARDRTLLAALVAIAVWTGISGLWSPSPSAAVLETQRTLVYVAGVLAALVSFGRRSVPALLAGVLAACTSVSLFGLLAKLLPEHLGTYDPIAGARLAGPVGYWNGLAAIAALGVVLAVGFAARAERASAKAVASSALVVLAPTLYFTFSRGGWLSIAVALVIALALDPRRWQLLGTLLAVAPVPAAAVVLAMQAHALAQDVPVLAAAGREGRQLGLELAGLAVLAAGAPAAAALVRERWSPGRQFRTAAAVAALVFVGGSAGLAVRYDAPARLAADFRNAPQQPTDPAGHLLSVYGSGRAAEWRVAWLDAEHHPLLGAGAGTFGDWWLLHRPTPAAVRDADNVYLEALAELGPIGLLLLLAVCALPLAAGVRARRQALVPIALGAYAGYLVQTGLDFLWELPAVTLAALLCGAALVLACRSETSQSALSVRMRLAISTAALGVAAFAWIGLSANRAVADAAAAIAAGRPAAARADALRAQGWAPWAPEPWAWLGEADLLAGRRAAALTAFRAALARDRHDWGRWLDVARASWGTERSRALRQAALLNPLDRGSLLGEDG